MDKFILALDQGTTSSRAILFNKKGEIVGVAQKEITQYYPKPGYVEHDPMEIWGTQSGVLREVLETNDISPSQIDCIGITNQRETVVVWDKETGKPIHPAIVWQCRRTADTCRWLEEEGYEEYIKEKTGLILDPYFSGTKIKWILDHVEGAKQKAQNGQLLAGTVDTWLIWKLTAGKLHITDYSNASRTLLFDIKECKWDEKILDLLDIPIGILPEVVESSQIYGYTNPKILGGACIPISGIAGDQQAALFGQRCFTKGMVKNTYGTGCFLLMNTGEDIARSSNGLLTTIAWKVRGKVCYALEGSIFMAGATIGWLRDEIHFIHDVSDSSYFANKVKDTNGVYVVPAFVGMGAPYWEMDARGTILGLTRGTNRDHIIRAALESIAYQTKDIVDVMCMDAGVELGTIRVDGGAAKNDFLMQFQSDILGREVLRAKCTESTARGAAYLAGFATGFWSSEEELDQGGNSIKYSPDMSEEVRLEKYKGWKRAVKCTIAYKEE